jgi:hypothetical protein
MVGLNTFDYLLVLGKPFRSILIFDNKARAYLSGAPLKCPLYSRLLALFNILDLSQKGGQEHAYTLAYLAFSSETKKRVS